MGTLSAVHSEDEEESRECCDWKVKSTQMWRITETISQLNKLKKFLGTCMMSGMNVG